MKVDGTINFMNDLSIIKKKIDEIMNKSGEIIVKENILEYLNDLIYGHKIKEDIIYIHFVNDKDFYELYKLCLAVNNKITIDSNSYEKMTCFLCNGLMYMKSGLMPQGQALQWKIKKDKKNINDLFFNSTIILK